MAGQYQLIMNSRPSPGKVFSLQKPEMIVGRDSSCDIQVDDAEMSRKHFRLYLQGGGYLLQDLGSTNGTAVNGQRVTAPYLLRPGDVIAIGQHISFTFQSEEIDYNATVAAPRQPYAEPAAPAAQPRNVQPVQAQYPPSPAVPPSVAYPAEKPKSKTGMIILIVVGALLLLIACIVFATIYFMPASWWCGLVPFLFPGACP